MSVQQSFLRIICLHTYIYIHTLNMVSPPSIWNGVLYWVCKRLCMDVKGRLSESLTFLHDLADF